MGQTEGLGLSSEEAKRRISQFGPNELPEKQTNPIMKFFGYFWGPIPWMIEVAVILSAVVKHWADFIIILVLLLANSVVAFWEEYQAGNTIDALKKKLAIKTRVKRDGQWVVIPSSQIVPGDVVRIRMGDIVPADIKLLDCDPISIDQSTITGESLPVTRKTGESAYSGSIVRQGEAEALVEKTGNTTFMGKTAQLAGEDKGASHFQKAVLKIGNYLIILAITLVAIIIIVAAFRGDKFLETLEFALILTVAAIPVALPTVLSVTLAVGARLLAKKEAIITRLAAIEELAGVNILCCDKTGTLTQNKLTLGEPFAAQGIETDDVILAARLASRRENADPIDLAILGDDTIKVSKGALQSILALINNDADVKLKASQAVENFAKHGFRSIAVARAEQDKWTFLGVLPLFDPPRLDSEETILQARQMGVKIKMATGDQIAIAKEISTQLGMGTNILDATIFSDPHRLHDGQTAKAIESADGFAQVFPEHKYHIVEVLQRLGNIVGMTGDGVNDSPALKKADAGIAVSGATDAARSASDIVLLDAGLSVIITAIKESRKIFQRMHSYATYRIAETIRILFFMTLSILIFNFYPVTAVMIVLLALLNDGAILSVAYDHVHYSNEPEKWNMKVTLGVATALGLAGVTASFLLFYFVEIVFHLPRPQIQTLIYLKLSVAGHLTIFLTRVRGPFWSHKPAKILFFAVLGTQIIATLIAVFGIFMTPISWSFAGLVWLYALAWFLVNDRIKLMIYKILLKEEPVFFKIRPSSGQAKVRHRYV